MVSGWPGSYLFTMVARGQGSRIGVEKVDVAEEPRTDGERESQENGCQLMHRWICLYRRGEREREKDTERESVCEEGVKRERVWGWGEKRGGDQGIACLLTILNSLPSISSALLPLFIFSVQLWDSAWKDTRSTFTPSPPWPGDNRNDDMCRRRDADHLEYPSTDIESSLSWQVYSWPCYYVHMMLLSGAWPPPQNGWGFMSLCNPSVILVWELILFTFG